MSYELYDLPCQDISGLPFHHALHPVSVSFVGFVLWVRMTCLLKMQQSAPDVRVCWRQKDPKKTSSCFHCLWICCILSRYKTKTSESKRTYSSQWQENVRVEEKRIKSTIQIDNIWQYESVFGPAANLNGPKLFGLNQFDQFSQHLHKLFMIPFPLYLHFCHLFGTRKHLLMFQLRRIEMQPRDESSSSLPVNSWSKTNISFTTYNH